MLAALGIPSRYAAGLFGQLSGELERVELDGEPAWAVAGDTRAPPGPLRGIRVLPFFAGLPADVRAWRRGR